MATVFLPKAKPARRTTHDATPDDPGAGGTPGPSIWSQYCKIARAHDDNLEKDWNEDLDVLLIVVCKPSNV